jgi:hypothetical protein
MDYPSPGMRTRHTLWLKIAIAFMFLTGALHAVSLVASPQPRTDTERQMIDLMQTYRLDMGDGFHPTMANLMTALSACFTFVCVLGGWMNAYLLRRRVAPDVLKGVVGIHLLVFGCVFAVMLALTFSPPIVLTGVIVVFLLLAYLTIPGKRTTA